MNVKETIKVKARPVISVAYLSAEAEINCGAAFDKKWKNGALCLLLDLTKLDRVYESENLRLKFFPKESFKNAVLLELTKNIESHYIAKLNGEEKPMLPLYDIVLGVDDVNIRLGSVWSEGVSELVLDAVIDPREIPESHRNRAIFCALFVKKLNLEIPQKYINVSSSEAKPEERLAV